MPSPEFSEKPSKSVSEVAAEVLARARVADVYYVARNTHATLGGGFACGQKIRGEKLGNLKTHRLTCGRCRDYVKRLISDCKRIIEQESDAT